VLDRQLLELVVVPSERVQRPLRLALLLFQGGAVAVQLLAARQELAVEHVAYACHDGGAG